MLVLVCADVVVARKMFCATDRYENNALHVAFVQTFSTKIAETTRAR